MIIIGIVIIVFLLIKFAFVENYNEIFIGKRKNDTMSTVNIVLKSIQNIQKKNGQ